MLRTAPPGTLPAALQEARADFERADLWWRDPGNSIDIATLFLRMSTPGEAPNGDRVLAAAARQALERSLVEAPGNGKAWIWLANARLVEQGPTQSAISAFVMSLVLARYEPSLLVWRCQVGLALYPALDSDNRERLAEQIRILAAVSTDDVARVARASGQIPVVVGVLSKEPSVLARFADRIKSIN
jgi:hypothetical protein